MDKMTVCGGKLCKTDKIHSVNYGDGEYGDEHNAYNGTQCRPEFIKRSANMQKVYEPREGQGESRHRRINLVIRRRVEKAYYSDRADADNH